MRSVRLLVMICLSAGLVAAGDGPATGDPFVVYHQAIEDRLSAILERDQAPPPRLSTPPRVEVDTAPDQNRDLEIKEFAVRFWGGKEAEFAAALGRLEQLRPRLEPLLRAEGVPGQLVAVVLIESGAQPLAVSPRRARGLWQLMPETAQQYGLTVNSVSDERVLLESATRGAARYLRDLYKRFGDWPLALAAYNAGQKAVESALEKGHMGTFWQLRSAGLLPAETRNYVPAVLAAMRLFGSTMIDAPAREEVRADDRVYASVGVSN